MKNYIKYFRKEVGTLIATVFLSLIIVVIGFIEPQLTSRVLIYLTKSNLHFVFYCAIAIFSINLLEVIVKFFNAKLSIRLNTKISYEISWNLAQKLANATSKSVLEFDSQELASRVAESNNFVGNISRIFKHIWNLIIGIAVLIYSAFVSLPIFLLFLLALIAILAIEKVMHSKQVDGFLEQRKTNETAKSFLVEICKAFLDVKSQNMTPYLKTKFTDLLSATTMSNAKIEILKNKNSILAQLLQITYIFLFLLLGIFLLSNNQISIENLVTLYMYKSYINVLVNSFLEISENLSAAKSSSIRMNEILQYECLQEEKFGTKHLRNIDGKLEIKNITMSINEKIILDNVSISIPKHSFIGIVGYSGCGKSTLLKVLAHELLPDSGKVLIDDIDINQLDYSSLHKIFQMIPQNSFIFNMSIRDNLKLVNPSATDEQIWQILELVDAQFCQEYGLDYVLDNQKLSGGQKQKIALARVALQTAKVILLDEATSALDNLSQDKIMHIIQNATKNHTIITVAHRLSTVKNADMLIFMEDGKIVATGTYDELYQTCPNFRKMADL